MGENPFASSQQLCHTSSSQEQHLPRCPFAGDDEFFSDNEPGSPGMPVDSTGIVMLSLPDSPYEKENGAGITQDDAEVSSSLPVSRDVAVKAGLGFSATETIETDLVSKSPPDNKVIHSEPINFRIEDDDLGETPWKKLKIVDKSLGFRRLNFEGGSHSNSLENGNVNGVRGDGSAKKNVNDEAVNEDRTMQQGNVGPCGENSCGKKRKHSGEKRAVPVSLSLQNNLNAQGDHQVESTKRNDKNKSKSMAVFDVLSEPCAENSCGKRKNSGALPVALLLQNNVNAQGDQVESTRRSSDDICAENSCGKRKDLGGEKRALPVSLLRNHLSAPEDRVERTRRLRDDTKKSMAVFDVLSEISEEYSSDPSLAKLSALEAAKRGGISFP